MSLAIKLRDRIAKDGPMTAADYMAACAAHYYANQSPFGKEGDFTTAPEISQIFGELMGAWLAERWGALGRPRASLVELGPGRGILMRDLLAATRHVKGFHEAVHVLMIETSPALCALQERALAGAHPHIRWQESLDPLPSLPLLLIANEFFDALPVHQYLGSGSERKVGWDDGRFVWQPGEEAVAREESPERAQYMARITRHIKERGGAALVVDYGYSEGVGDTLQAVWRHRYAGPLENPGEVDITAHVDFNALKKAAQAAGGQVFGPVEQGAFLRRLGAELRATALCKKANPEQQKEILSGLERLMAPHEMGSLFKALAVTSLPDVPAGFSPGETA